MSFLRERIAEIDDLRLRYDEIAIEADSVKEATKSILAQKVELVKEAALVASSHEPETVRRWLGELPIKEEVVYIYFVSDKQGIRLSFNLFIKHYDDLWFPSSDDVWITNKSLSWLLELDHEEVFTYYAPSDF